MIRPAKEVRAEVDAKKNDCRQKGLDRQRKDIAKKIEDNKDRGKITVLGIPPEIQKELDAAGYVVKYHRACGMGDHSSYSISW
jgi:hypothetical protein